MIERLKAAFVDDRLTREELDARVGRALRSRTRTDLALVIADISVEAGTVEAGTVEAGAAKAGAAKAGAARVGMAGAVAVAVTVVLTLVTSIPPLFLLLVACHFTAMIAAGAWMLSSRHAKRAG